MDFLRSVRVIQGGMGVHVSNWRLARAVAGDRPGVTAGTVSGTALDVVYARLLQLGDPGGHARRALRALDETHGGGLGAAVCARYFIEGGKEPEASFRNTPPHALRLPGGTATLPLPDGASTSLAVALDTEAVELLIATAFAEVWLAREGHAGRIFINFLNKIEIPLIFALYGAMLAGVDGVLVGAGNPDGLPDACSRLTRHEPVSRRVSVLYRDTGEEFMLRFDPHEVAGGCFTRAPLKRPAFLAIVSLEDLAKALAASDSEAPDGFVIEHHSAGGHNANPLGPLTRDERGQPVYGPRDEADLASMRALGIPFWLAGGYGSAEGLARARAAGAVGIQMGSAFALAEESGMKPEYRAAVLSHFKAGGDDESLVRTTLFSPTGFSFKVAQVAGTLSDQDVYDSRRRVCDLGVLQQWGLGKPDESGQRVLMHRCPSGPVDSYVRRRGIERGTEQRRCLCNGLMASVGLGQVRRDADGVREEPAIITLGSHLDGARRLSRQGQVHYWARDVVADVLGDPPH